jgi:hypothetical protein
VPALKASSGEFDTNIDAALETVAAEIYSKAVDRKGYEAQQRLRVASQTVEEGDDIAQHRRQQHHVSR